MPPGFPVFSTGPRIRSNLEFTMQISRRNKTSRHKAKLKAKKRKERSRKHKLLVKRKAGGRLNKRLKREPHAW
jgi:hypothetical protein